MPEQGQEPVIPAADEKKPERGTDITENPESAVSTDVMDFGRHEGAGYEGSTGQDYQVPFFNLIQGLNPELKKKNAAYIEGAEEGMFFNSVTRDLYNGVDGKVFVPAYTEHVFVEWKPRKEGGGFVGVHTIDSAIIKEAKERATEFGQYTTEKGNDLVETYYIYAIVMEDENDWSSQNFVLMAFKSTQIKPYKQIRTRLKMFTIPDAVPPKKPPLYAHRVRISSVDDSNVHGEFKNVMLVPAVENSVLKSLVPASIEIGEARIENPILVSGEAFGKMVKDGMARASYESVTNTGAGGDESDEDVTDGDGNPVF